MNFLSAFLVCKSLLSKVYLKLKIEVFGGEYGVTLCVGRKVWEY